MCNFLPVISLVQDMLLCSLSTTNCHHGQRLQGSRLLLDEMDDFVTLKYNSQAFKFLMLLLSESWTCHIRCKVD
jgi:hypothetical protein